MWEGGGAQEGMGGERLESGNKGDSLKGFYCKEPQRNKVSLETGVELVEVVCLFVLRWRNCNWCLYTDDAWKRSREAESLG